MKTVNPEEMPLVLLGHSSPSRSQGIVPTFGERFFKQSKKIYPKGPFKRVSQKKLILELHLLAYICIICHASEIVLSGHPVCTHPSSKREHIEDNSAGGVDVVDKDQAVYPPLLGGLPRYWLVKAVRPKSLVLLPRDAVLVVELLLQVHRHRQARHEEAHEKGR